jgi:hypothetical protein
MVYTQRKQEKSSMKVRKYLAPPIEDVAIGPQDITMNQVQEAEKLASLCP